jgi:hypothetical protein
MSKLETRKKIFALVIVSIYVIIIISSSILPFIADALDSEGENNYFNHPKSNLPDVEDTTNSKNPKYNADVISTRSGNIKGKLNTFSTGSSQFTVLSEPASKSISIPLPPGVNVTKAKMSITGKTRDPINKYMVGSRPVFILNADLNNDGHSDLITSDLDKHEFYVLLGTGELSFHSITTYPTGELPLWGTVRDLNNDGYLDMATANEGANTITVYQNTGSGEGTFDSRKDYKIGDIPRSIASGDFNSDGWLDLASVSSNDNKLWINLNKKTETISFKEASNLTTDGAPVGIISGDVNLDGKDDIIIIHVSANISINKTKFPNSVSVLINKGEGAFLPRVNYIVDKKPSGLLLDDFNSDGWPDIATSNRVGNDVSILLNKGDGRFKNSVNYSLIERASAGRNMRTGDIDGDGDKDIVSLCSVNNTLQILRSNGDGTFKPFEEYTAGHSPEDLVLEDFDEDGDLDVATANLFDGSISLVENNGDGVYTTSEFYRVGGWPRGIGHGDVDNDGDLDLITANYLGGSLTIRYNNGKGYFPIRYDRHIAVEPFAVIIEDFDKDGYLDLASADEGLFELVLIFNDGDGNYIKREKLSYELGGYPYAILYHDFNNDGRKDLITSNNLQQSISILWNIGNESGDSFAPFENYSFAHQHPFGLAYGDMDGDGDDDLLCTNLGFESDPESNISIIWNDGNSSFTSHTNYKVGINPINLDAVDIDLDGDLDVVVANKDTNSTSVLINNDNKTLTNRRDYGVGPLPMGIESIDFDKDGDIDIITGNHGNDSLSILHNNGDGTFAKHIEYPSGPQPTYISIADFNGDGALDIATPNKLSSTITVHMDLHHPADINLDIGNSGTPFFEHKGKLKKTVDLPDFTEQLNAYLITHETDYIQTPTGPAILVPIKIEADKTGIIEFNQLEIEYFSPDDFDLDNLPDSIDDDDDDDGASDDWELANNFNPKDPADAAGDLDNDSLSNLEEFLNGTEPAVSDSDDDGLLDGEEVKTYFTDPNNKDTDSDGFDDAEEIKEDTDPNDKTDHPEEESEGGICFTPGFGIDGFIIALVLIIILIIFNPNRKQ